MTEKKTMGIDMNKRVIPRFNGASDDPFIEARLREVMDHMYGFYHTEIELSLDRTYRFLERLGNPHLRLPQVVHVAGTNGKGSTIATLRALLEASGQTVHIYSSPHLVHPTERIRLAGNPITSQGLIDVLTECIEINNGEPITFFEMFTCAAFLAFSRVSADWLLLETGMGGRLDTTNVVAHPKLAIITTISYDHMKFLGDSLTQIAFEKAGIMKSGVPCVIGHQTDEAVQAGVINVFQNYSTNLSTEAPLVREGAHWASAPESDQLLFRYGSDSIALPKPALLGNHQYWNAGAALAAFRIIAPEHFKADTLSTGLANVEWPGRLQTLETHPYKDLLPEDWHLIIDGGHNDSAGMVLGEQMKSWKEHDPRALHIIIAMVNRKDPAAFLKPLLPYAASITATRIKGEATSFQPDELAVLARELGFQNVSSAPDARTALVQLAARHKNKKKSRVLITGSLFLMGNILAE
ncbi:MAG: bifunctional folylpolyglutamate synthase/dihydrofolate synthase [Micavibrio aeruginosavorus]|uniref:tetrahydrofolate synthase n=1 Tax=Micavibrio aeruginosavorus TaxID=349221 RepID=A0A2W5ND22_9BACT|nr:MAG: bifunctional folylpolyglutamate synthase/dihydrofolate synthase [Micavibrio aeruginosavorus]